MRLWHTAFPPASRSSKAFNTGVTWKLLGHMPHLWPWLELEFKSLCHRFSFHSVQDEERFSPCSQLHTRPAIFPPQATFYWRYLCNCFYPPHTWLYFSFKCLNVRGSATDEVLFPRPVKSLIPSWISFSGNIAPRNMSRKLTNPIPMSFSGPTKPPNAQEEGWLGRIRDPYKTDLNPSQQDTFFSGLIPYAFWVLKE